MWDKDVVNIQRLAKAILALMLSLSVTLIERAFAETTAELMLKPDRCVAMNEGQTCYQTLAVNWQTETPGDYCLFEQGIQQPIVCWQNTDSGKTKLEFAAEGNTTYQLVLKAMPETQQTMVVETEVIVTWVYSKTKKRKNSWRLF
jgi:hypothetical protein